MQRNVKQLCAQGKSFLHQFSYYYIKGCLIVPIKPKDKEMNLFSKSKIQLQNWHLTEGQSIYYRQTIVIGCSKYGQVNFCNFLITDVIWHFQWRHKWRRSPTIACLELTLTRLSCSTADCYTHVERKKAYLPSSLTM